MSEVKNEGVCRFCMKILARNNPMEFDCCKCKKKATHFYMEDEDFFCKKMSQKI